MGTIASWRGALVSGLLCCAACGGGRGGGGGIAPLLGTTYTFTTVFGTDGCPQSSKADVANCGNGKDDCVKIYARDRVKFRPAAAGDPKYSLQFTAASKLTTKPDAAADDGKHWDLQIASDTPRNVEHKFTVVSDACPSKPLDPTIIIMP